VIELGDERALSATRAASLCAAGDAATTSKRSATGGSSRHLGRYGGGVAATDSDPRSTDQAEPRSAAVTFVTTEHFVLQGARAATIAESNGRANMFLAAVSGGLVALGLVATASSLGAAFYFHRRGMERDPPKYLRGSRPYD
jgi:hypothetical protein